MSSFTTELPPYPEGTPYLENKQGNYWPNLSPDHKKSFEAVQAWVTQDNIDLSGLGRYCLDFNLTILRYLRANNFDSKKAINHMKDNLIWRKEMNVDELIKKTPDEILGIEMEQLTKVFPHWHFGYDKTGRPVIVKQYGKFDATKIKELVGGNYDKVVQYHIWEQEIATQLCLQQSQKTGKIVETVTGIVDVKDMRLSQITRDFLHLTKVLADVDQKQYPETLGRIYIINAPMAFPIVWRMVKPWLDPVTTSKIFVFGGPSEYEPQLIDFIGKDNLPKNYAGTLPELNPMIHPYAETMKEFGSKVNLDIVSNTPEKSSADNNSTVDETESDFAVKFDELKEEVEHIVEEDEKHLHFTAQH